jgi:hypothetical protein
MKIKKIIFLVFIFYIFSCGFSNAQDLIPHLDGKIRVSYSYKDIDGTEKFGYKYINVDDVIKNEVGVVESQSFMYSYVIPQVVEENTLGWVLRRISKIDSPFTYDLPYTKDLFDRINKINTDSESEKIIEIYNIVAEAIPNYGTPNSEILNLDENSTFEEVLSTGTGICRDQAAILNTAFHKHNINSWVVFEEGGEHVWVRVKTFDGEEFDLDPTWYKDFVKLDRRIDSKEDINSSGDIVGSQCENWSLGKVAPDMDTAISYCKSLGDDYRIPNEDDFLNLPGEGWWWIQSAYKPKSIVYTNTSCLRPGYYWYNSDSNSVCDYTGISIGTLGSGRGGLKDDGPGDTYKDRTYDVMRWASGSFCSQKEVDRFVSKILLDESKKYDEYDNYDRVTLGNNTVIIRCIH